MLISGCLALLGLLHVFVWCSKDLRLVAIARRSSVKRVLLAIPAPGRQCDLDEDVSVGPAASGRRLGWWICGINPALPTRFIASKFQVSLNQIVAVKDAICRCRPTPSVHRLWQGLRLSDPCCLRKIVAGQSCQTGGSQHGSCARRFCSAGSFAYSFRRCR